jgi:hypothetical protein
MRQVIALLTLALLAPACDPDGGGPNNRPGTLQFSASSYSVGESGGSVTITVRRTGGSRGVASVLYSAVNGTATAGQDYTVPPGTGMLVWSDGDASDKSFDVTILGDGVAEENETVLLSLAAPSAASLGTPSSATLRIVDDDSTSPAGTLRFDPEMYSFYEGVLPLQMLAPNVVTVTRTGGSAGAVSVMVTIAGGTATQDVDYHVSIPGPLAGVVLTWGDGETGPKNVVVDVLDDGLKEGNETILFSLANVTGGALIGSPKEATVTLLDDETP